MVHVASWPDERLSRRPKEEDHRSPQEGHDQDRGRPRLLREPLLGQALRQARPGGTPARPEEAPRLQAEDGRERQEALGSGHGRARPSATLSERCEYLGRVAGLSVSESTVSRMLRRLGWGRKKDRWERQSATSS